MCLGISYQKDLDFVIPLKVLFPSIGLEIGASSEDQVAMSLLLLIVLQTSMAFLVT